MVESLDSGDTRTTEEEGAKNDEIQPEDDTPQVQLEEEGDQLETEKSDFVGNGHRHSVQTRKPVTTLLSMTASAENLVNLSDLLASVHLQDADLWRTLEDVQLKVLVESLEGQLDHELLEHGVNVSVGERQLICLARVLLQQNKIVILDEPIAHVDPEIEQTIWNVVCEKLKDSTVITIAHRLNIGDCDMILVLKDGELKKSDKFDLLVNREGSVLSEMAQAAKFINVSLSF
ncbi:multidrug resistance-associated protein 4-like [Orbicella faveolata]|uniref:multidrug resistance-associated protein 4-like n=1 Tax=Orbicella faveolata TaxID=48498 RepID=UPI0009E23E2B|nr:multidrug resistance-associated protein 4-like [Orbicella faveolata]